MDYFQTMVQRFPKIPNKWKERHNFSQNKILGMGQYVMSFQRRVEQRVVLLHRFLAVTAYYENAQQDIMTKLKALVLQTGLCKMVFPEPAKSEAELVFSDSFSIYLHYCIKYLPSGTDILVCERPNLTESTTMLSVTKMLSVTLIRSQ